MKTLWLALAVFAVWTVAAAYAVYRALMWVPGGIR